MTNKLESKEAFRYVWYGLRFLGIHPFETHKTLYQIYSILVTVGVTFLAPLQLVIQAFFVESFAQLMLNMSTSFELSCCSLKVCVIFYFRAKLLKTHDYLEKLDRRAEEFPADKERMKSIVKNCRRIYIIYKVLFWLTLSFFAIAGALTGRLIFDGWLPFDWKSSTKLYIAALSYQWFNACYQCIMNLTSDVYSVLYAYVLLGHMECLSRRISSIGYGDDDKDSDEKYRELIRCIYDHRNTLEYFDSLSYVISGTIFVQFLVTAFVLCMTAISFLMFTQNLTYLVTSFCYITAVLGEVLPCCYLINEIMDASSNMTTAIYSCNWMDQDRRFRRAVITFMQRSQKQNTIMAGRLIPISLPTFMSLIRVSFSMFTLLASW